MSHTPTEDTYFEASELGMKPGEWPETLGDGYWTRTSIEMDHDVIHFVTYTHASRKMVVFND